MGHNFLYRHKRTEIITICTDNCPVQCNTIQVPRLLFFVKIDKHCPFQNLFLYMELLFLTTQRIYLIEYVQLMRILLKRMFLFSKKWFTVRTLCLAEIRMLRHFKVQYTVYYKRSLIPLLKEVQHMSI